VVGHVEETRYPPYIMLNPAASAAEDGGADHERSATIPEAAGDARHPAGPDDRAAAVESEIVEEYLQE
jgi:hypothetical protein